MTTTMILTLLVSPVEIADAAMLENLWVSI